MSYEFKKVLPVIGKTEVLAVGAGPAGIGAALSSARNGADTFLIDVNGCVGGMATVGMVGPFMTSFDAKAENMVIRGIFEEIVDDMVEAGHAVHPKDVHNGEPYSSFFRIGHNNVGPFSAEYFKLVCTNKLQEAGVKILLNTQFIDVIKEGDKITGVVVANKDGMGVIESDIVIDCSGDADVAYRSGVDCSLGNEETGNIQPMSLFLRVGNVDTEKLIAHMEEHKSEIRPFFGPFSWTIKEHKEDWGNIPRGEICVFKDVEDGIYHLNVTRINNADATKTEDLTRGEIECLQQCFQVHEFMKKHCPGFENSVIVDIADTMGIRETRHIDGEYKLTGQEVADCKLHDDDIAVMATCMDTHNLDDEGGTFVPPTAGDYFGVPYPCLVAKGIDNLFVAGRSISAESMAASAIRMMPSCMAFGEAAGVAAAMAIKDNVAPKDVDSKKLVDKLKSQGAYVGDK